MKPAAASQDRTVRHHRLLSPAVRLWSLLLFVLCLISTSVQAQPVYAWQVRSSTATLYLLGSLHAFPPNSYPLPAPIEAAFDLSDYLVVEINPTDMSIPEQQKLIDHYGLLPQGQTLKSVLPNAVWLHLQSACAQLRLRCALMEDWQPWRAGTQIVLSSAKDQGFDTESGIDHYFMKRAGSRKILALETLESQLKAISSPGMDMQIENLSSTLDQLDNEPDFLPDLYSYWATGDGPGLYQLMQKETVESKTLKEYMDILNARRNIAMTDQLERLLKTKGTYFVVVGALHLPGPDGILERLKARHYPSQQLQAPRLKSRQ
ncbi:TraB/GumN family protein [Pokkaliibacter sp. CJK22405]|uniref:TraB/GumN family protein n=1 Tax=Pokkaliibacter sp. CJK22405 TaxID=3384615 RepID=UPI003984BB64